MSIVFKKSIFYTLTTIFSVICLVLMIFSGNIDSAHWAILLLPIVTLFGGLLLWASPLRLQFGMLCIFLFYYFRYNIVALFSVYGNYYIETSENIYLKYFNRACLLMGVEFSVVLLVLFLTKQTRKIDYGRGAYSKSDILVPKSIVLLLIAYCSILLFMYPQLYSNFILFFQNTETRLAIKAEYIQASKSIPGILFYSFVYSIEFLRILLPFLILTNIYNNNYSYILKTLSIFLLFIGCISITTHVQITGFFVSIIIAYYLMEKNFKTRKRILVPFLVLFLLLFIYAMDEYSGLDSNIMVSRVLQNYFNGPSNVAAGLAVDRKNFLLIHLNDIMYSSTLLSGLFGIQLNHTSTEIFFTTTRDYTRSSIFPFIAQARFYYGYLIAPIATAFTTWLVLFFERKVYKETNELYRLLYMFICLKLASCTAMYFTYSVYNTIFDLIIPVYILTKIKIKHGRSL